MNSKTEDMIDTPVFHTIDIARFRRAFASADSIGIGNDFCIVDMKYDKCLEVLTHPCRLNAYLAFFCISGRLRLNVNMTEFEVRENTLFINIPGDIMHVAYIEESQKDRLRFVVVAASKAYLSGVHVDIDRLFSEGMRLIDNPCSELMPQEKETAASYLELAHRLLTSAMPYKRECIGQLLSSVFYYAAGIYSRNRGSAHHCPAAGTTARCRTAFDSFLKLVARHHTVHRDISFYAGEMCVSTKYLSKLVKKATGRTAADWIDSYVITEAKNMLRYSDMSIKEIIEALHFSDQSSFTKFFRKRTGQTPRQYRIGPRSGTSA